MAEQTYTTGPPAGYVLYNGQMVPYSQYLAETNKPVGNPDAAMIATLNEQQYQQQQQATPYISRPAPPVMTPEELQAAYDAVEQGRAPAPDPIALNLNTEYAKPIVVQPVTLNMDAQPYTGYREPDAPAIDPFTANVGGNEIVITRAVVQPNNSDLIAYEGYYPNLPESDRYVIGSTRVSSGDALGGAAAGWATAHPEVQFDTPEGIAASNKTVYDHLIGTGEIQMGDPIFGGDNSGGRTINPYVTPEPTVVAPDPYDTWIDNLRAGEKDVTNLEGNWVIGGKSENVAFVRPDSLVFPGWMAKQQKIEYDYGTYNIKEGHHSKDVYSLEGVRQESMWYDPMTNRFYGANAKDPLGTPASNYATPLNTFERYYGEEGKMTLNQDVLNSIDATMNTRPQTPAKSSNPLTFDIGGGETITGPYSNKGIEDARFKQAMGEYAANNPVSADIQKMFASGEVYSSPNGNNNAFKIATDQTALGVIPGGNGKNPLGTFSWGGKDYTDVGGLGGILVAGGTILTDLGTNWGNAVMTGLPSIGIGGMQVGLGDVPGGLLKVGGGVVGGIPVMAGGAVLGSEMIIQDYVGGNVDHGVIPSGFGSAVGTIGPQAATGFVDNFAPDLGTRPVAGITEGLVNIVMLVEGGKSIGKVGSGAAAKTGAAWEVGKIRSPLIADIAPAFEGPVGTFKAMGGELKTMFKPGDLTAPVTRTYNVAMEGGSTAKMTVVTPGEGNFMSAMMDMAATPGRALSPALGGVGDAAVGTIGVARGLGQTDFVKASLDMPRDTFTSVKDFTVNSVKTGVKAGSDIYGPKIDDLAWGTKGVIENTKNVFGDVGTAISTRVEPVVTSARTTGRNIGSTVSEIYSPSVDNIIWGTKGVIEGGRTVGRDVFSDIGTGAGKVRGAVSEIYGPSVDNIVWGTRGIIEGGRTVGRDIGTGIGTKAAEIRRMVPRGEFPEERALRLERGYDAAWEAMSGGRRVTPRSNGELSEAWGAAAKAGREMPEYAPMFDSLMGSIEALDSVKTRASAPGLDSIWGKADGVRVEKAIAMSDPDAYMYGSATARTRVPNDLDIIANKQKLGSNIRKNLKRMGFKDSEFTVKGDDIIIKGKKISVHSKEDVARMSEGSISLEPRADQFVRTPGGLKSTDYTAFVQGKAKSILQDIYDQPPGKTGRGKPWRSGKDVSDFDKAIKWGDEKGLLPEDVTAQLTETMNIVKGKKFRFSEKEGAPITRKTGDQLIDQYANANTPADYTPEITTLTTKGRKFVPFENKKFTLVEAETTTALPGNVRYTNPLLSRLRSAGKETYMIEEIGTEAKYGYPLSDKVLGPDGFKIIEDSARKGTITHVDEFSQTRGIVPEGAVPKNATMRGPRPVAKTTSAKFDSAIDQMWGSMKAPGEVESDFMVGLKPSVKSALDDLHTHSARTGKEKGAWVDVTADRVLFTVKGDKGSVDLFGNNPISRYINEGKVRKAHAEGHELVQIHSHPVDFPRQMWASGGDIALDSAMGVSKGGPVSKSMIVTAPGKKLSPAVAAKVGKRVFTYDLTKADMPPIKNRYSDSTLGRTKNKATIPEEYVRNIDGRDVVHSDYFETPLFSDQRNILKQFGVDASTAPSTQIKAPGPRAPFGKTKFDTAAVPDDGTVGMWSGRPGIMVRTKPKLHLDTSDFGYKRVGQKVVMDESMSELQGVYVAPTLESYFMKVTPGNEKYSIGLGLNNIGRSPSAVRMEGLKLRDIPDDVRAGGYDAMQKWIDSDIDANGGGRAYTPRNKRELEAVVSSRNVFEVVDTGKAVKMGGYGKNHFLGQKYPIIEVRPTGELVDVAALKASKGIDVANTGGKAKAPTAGNKGTRFEDIDVITSSKEYMPTTEINVAPAFAAAGTTAKYRSESATPGKKYNSAYASGSRPAKSGFGSSSIGKAIDGSTSKSLGYDVNSLFSSKAVPVSKYTPVRTSPSRGGSSYKAPSDPLSAIDTPSPYKGGGKGKSMIDQMTGSDRGYRGGKNGYKTPISPFDGKSYKGDNGRGHGYSPPKSAFDDLFGGSSRGPGKSSKHSPLDISLSSFGSKDSGGYKGDRSRGWDIPEYPVPTSESKTPPYKSKSKGTPPPSKSTGSGSYRSNPYKYNPFDNSNIPKLKRDRKDQKKVYKKKKPAKLIEEWANPVWKWII